MDRAWSKSGVLKGLPFEPKPSTPKFVDPQDVEFTIKDLLKDRHIGEYQDLAPGGEQFLSRSRVHTAPGKGKQRIEHKDWMLNLDMESVFFHVPIYPKHLKLFSNHLALPLFVNNKFIELQSGGVSALGCREVVFIGKHGQNS
jgi:hypothetical protein